MPRALLSYLKLIRLPNVFSALADIVAGYFIAHQLVAVRTLGAGRAQLDFGKLALLLGASAGLYLSGMAFNDIADRKADARERPERPIPSGAVSLGGAVVCALGLMSAGLMFAWLCGELPLKIAVVLAVSILAYDFICKQPAAMKLILPGPLALGICRGSNMLLGMSTAAGIEAGMPLNSRLEYFWMPVLASGFYGASVTAFSVQEETGKNFTAIFLGWFFLCLAFSAAVLLCITSEFNLTTFILALIVIGLLYWELGKRTETLVETGTPAAARALVLTGLKGYCPLDASLLLGCAGLAGVLPAAAVLLLLYPGAWLRKKLAQFEA